MMLAKGLDCWGYDPTYEGTNSRIIKEYFSSEYSGIEADVIILRHTMEHISNPFSFLHTIAQANNYRGKIFIEVPTFNWIESKNAFWDIFYEHCNYFTLSTLQNLFTKSVGGHFFNGQYIYVIADLGDVKDSLDIVPVKPYEVKFSDKIKQYDQLISGLNNVAIWGVGAKGSTFLNLLDKDCTKIKCVVDINPKKQHRYVGGTGHYIIKPEELAAEGIENIIVMNINYIDEIKAITEPLNIKLITL